MPRHLFRRDYGKGDWIDLGPISPVLLSLTESEDEKGREQEVIGALLEVSDIRGEGPISEFEVRDVP